MPRHLIIGISGQDGAYLASRLLNQGEYVLGTSRAIAPASLPNLEKVGVARDVEVLSCTPSDEAMLDTIIQRHAIDRIYLLAGQSSVGLSFTQPAETYRGLITPALAVLELMRQRFPHIRLLYAGSGEVFSPDDGLPFTEKSRHSPKSPYAAAKSAAMTLVDTYRDVYRLFAANAILFNHESPLRPESFVLPKIVAAAARMSHGSDERLPLGDIDISRDWGWAPDYVEAMHMIVEHSTAANFVVATGATHTIREALTLTGHFFGFDLLSRCDLAPALLRPCDARLVRTSPLAIQRALGWHATVAFREMIARLCEAAAARSQKHPT